MLYNLKLNLETVTPAKFGTFIEGSFSSGGDILLVFKRLLMMIVPINNSFLECESARGR